MPKIDFYKLALEWFLRAQDDLLFATAGFKESGIARATCFLSQQAAEKYLKGFLVANGVEPPRTHILPELLTACIKINKEFAGIAEECEFLNQFYNPARYPGGVDLDFSHKLGEKALLAGEAVEKFIQHTINIKVGK